MSIHEMIAGAERSNPTIWLNKEGEHLLALEKLSTEELPTAGKKMIAKFKVIESEGYPTGAVVSFSWDVYQNKPQWREREIKKCKTFLCELLGQQEVSASVVEDVEAGKHKGTKIKAVGVMQAPKERQDGSGMTKPFCAIYFHNHGGAVEQEEKPASVLGQLK